jgi:hypothetical protein
MPPTLLRQLAEAKARREVLADIAKVRKEQAKPKEPVIKEWQVMHDHHDFLTNTKVMTHSMKNRMQAHML